MTPDPRLCSWRCRGTSNCLKNSSPKNLKNGSCCEGDLRPGFLMTRVVETFTTTGVTCFATATKPCSVEGIDKATRCVEFWSLTAWLNGNQFSPVAVISPRMRPML